ncbi:MAG TPA: GTP cyclohydrolase II [Candidatus Acidoferrum sp.]|nr:GTP cyclohydrolase II [Candidatus Acidoferrum sp.]
MTNARAKISPADSTDPAILVAVDRATAELRRGGPVVLHDQTARVWLVVAAETAEDEGIAQLRAMGEGDPQLVLTAERAAALGLGQESGEVVSLLLPARLPAAVLWHLADPTAARLATAATGLARGDVPVDIAVAVVELTKLARLLPAAIVAPLRLQSATHAADWARSRDLLDVSVGALDSYQQVAARSLRMVSEARVPLAGAENTRVIAFRPGDGGTEHLAIIIGEPPRDRPVLTRLHSECFTGDLLGSLRCDCGDQLRGAVDRISAAGGGVLLYLAQEGRGIGLANKLRAYELQDAGVDTIEADQLLGFRADERTYGVAAAILRELGIERIRLLTNNPQKLQALRDAGIDVVARKPLAGSVNPHNTRYLRAKQERAGHLLADTEGSE